MNRKHIVYKVNMYEKKILSVDLGFEFEMQHFYFLFTKNIPETIKPTQKHQKSKAVRIELKGCVGLPDCWMMHLYSLSFLCDPLHLYTVQYLYVTAIITVNHFFVLKTDHFDTLFLDYLSIHDGQNVHPPLPTIVKWLNFADSWSLLTQHLHFAYLNQIKES